MRLETERLVFRRPLHGDVEALFRLASDPAFASTVAEVPDNVPDIRTYLEAHCAPCEPELDKCYNLLIERKEDGRVVGLVTLISRKHRQGQVGYALHADDQGRGYATEGARALVDHAFAAMGLHRIYADTRDDNVVSWKVMERLGMRREAQFREAVEVGGERRDLVVYGILAKEWRGRA